MISFVFELYSFPYLISLAHLDVLHSRLNKAGASLTSVKITGNSLILCCSLRL